jgi:predicted RNase H-like HicB family nuclease
MKRRRTKMKPRTLEDYVDLPYDVNLTREELSNGEVVFLARHPELRGCMAQASTPDEALAELAEVRRLHLDALLSSGVTPPLPTGQIEPAFRIVIVAGEMVAHQLIAAVAEESTAGAAPHTSSQQASTVSPSSGRNRVSATVERGELVAAG